MISRMGTHERINRLNNDKTYRQIMIYQKRDRLSGLAGTEWSSGGGSSPQRGAERANMQEDGEFDFGGVLGRMEEMKMLNVVTG